MSDSANFIERVFLGRAHPITYLFAGFVGSALIGFLVLSLYGYLGRFATYYYQVFPPIITMFIGLFFLTITGLTYSVWIWLGCWNHFKNAKSWLSGLLLGLAITHACITLLIIAVFLAFNIGEMQRLSEGVWRLGD